MTTKILPSEDAMGVARAIRPVLFGAYTKQEDDRALTRLAKDIRQAPAAKHTPGPWKVCMPAASDGAPCGGLTVRYEGPSHRWHIATVYGQDKPTGIKYDQGENAANARLIAAAPDLLEACELLVQAYARAEGPSGSIQWEDLDAAHAAAKQAVANAGGAA